MQVEKYQDLTTEIRRMYGVKNVDMVPVVVRTIVVRPRSFHLWESLPWYQNTAWIRNHIMHLEIVNCSQNLKRGNI